MTIVSESTGFSHLFGPGIKTKVTTVQLAEAFKLIAFKFAQRQRSPGGVGVAHFG
jgi:hypothetical protein